MKLKSSTTKEKQEIGFVCVARKCSAGLVSVRCGLQRAALAAWNVSLYTVQSCLLPVVKLCLWGLAASTLAGDLLPYLGKACVRLWGPALVVLFYSVCGTTGSEW